MEINYDTEYNILHIVLQPAKFDFGCVKYSKEIVPDTIFMGYLEDDTVYDIEILGNDPLVFKNITTNWNKINANN